ncbi:hypothetical protein POM88_043615 [Heracleum sosnowskyi]|uniref:Uncharacterized protein n=1 Tax=Heracleum sosnowskyi TaxID=360622 RepID=A0AAD8H401_9APIA|nr:hypothetical protein POM88_043615 [Heracleum sosnowskyi]
MYRQYSSRNQRNKGFKTNNEILKLGRKNPHPQVKEPSKKNEKHEEADKDIEVDIKAEGEEDEVEGGDVGVDELDQPKSDSELHSEKVIIDEEKELEGVDEKKNEEKLISDKDSKFESSEDNLDLDRSTKNTHEAREENYKADDASSAVTNEVQTFSSESESAKNGTSSMVNPEKGLGVLNSTSWGSIFHNSTVSMESTDKSKSSNATAELNTELRDLLNGTEISILDLSRAQNDTDEGKGSAAGSNIQTVSSELTNSSSIPMANSLSDSNTTDTISIGYVESDLGTLSNFSNNQTTLEHTVPSSASAEPKDSSEISVIEKNTDTHQTDKSDLSTGADGNSGDSDSSNTENASKIQNGTVDSIVMEDKLPQFDLEKLPNLRMEASNSEVAADE